VFGIGDSLLLDRRAAELAGGGGLDLEALDLALYNWGLGERATLGLGRSSEPDEVALATLRQALGL
jgi:hypothetical protein